MRKWGHVAFSDRILYGLGAITSYQILNKTSDWVKRNFRNLFSYNFKKLFVYSCVWIVKWYWWARFSMWNRRRSEVQWTWRSLYVHNVRFAVFASKRAEGQHRRCWGDPDLRGWGLRGSGTTELCLLIPLFRWCELNPCWLRFVHCKSSRVTLNLKVSYPERITFSYNVNLCYHSFQKDH